jgi:predicted ATPase
MKYKKFILSKYKSISKPITIDFKCGLIPIIGENECGKTTILKGIFAFDYFNDKLTDGDHLMNVKNQYNPADSEPAKISAIISLDTKDRARYTEIIKAVHKGSPLSESGYDSIISNQPDEIKITRYFNGEKFYSIDDNILSSESKTIQDNIAKEIIRELPYILYFDDFMDSIPDEIIIQDKDISGWQETMELLLRNSNDEYRNLSLKDLQSKEENAIQSIESDISNTLTTTITEKWTTMRLESVQNFEIKFIYNKEKPSIKLKVVEKIDKKDRTFDIRQRSKGFYWFFNFVIKSQFNPKADTSNSVGVIFLLDEPGAYLHVSMQEKLCEKLAELAKTSMVIYCTHSHNLLKPEYIDISNIHICHRDGADKGNILMQKIGDYANNSSIAKQRKKLAFEPVYHVLGISDVLINGTRSNILLTEGITDFYTFQMFKTQNCQLSFLPSTNANHIQYNIPTFLACDRKFMCLYDSDGGDNGEGTKELKNLKKIFGDEIENISFTTNDIKDEIQKIEDLYDPVECQTVQIEDFKYSNEQIVDIKKFIKKLFFANNRDCLINKLPKTSTNIKEFIGNIETKFQKYYESQTN